MEISNWKWSKKFIKIKVQKKNNWKETKEKMELGNIESGMILEGKVKNIKPYGAFIEVESGITGLLRIDDISISRIKNPSERLNIGQNIKVMVKSIDISENKINFSHKELLGNWDENIENGETVVYDGKITVPEE